MDDSKFLRLLHINEGLIEICKSLAENHDSELLSTIIPLANDLARLVAELSGEKM